LVAYAVGSNISNIVATAFIPAGPGTVSYPGAQAGVDPPSVVVTVIGSTSITVRYVLPTGSLPQQDKDWLGIWQGQGPSVLYSVPPTAFSPVPGNMSPGTMGLPIQLLRGTQYTVGYFKGGYDSTTPKQTTLAATSTFMN
jgi:hypothetical protein